MEKKLIPLIINPELAKVAPPLAEHEKAILKEDILEHGCKFPLIVWDGVIVDGHNRYAICMENNIPFGIEEMEFSDMTEAKIWIIRNQLGRRNLTDFQRCEMVLPLENEMREDGKRRMNSSTRDSAVKIFSGRTRDILSDMAGVSFPTLNCAKFLIAEADEDMLDKLRHGKMKIHSAYKQLMNKKPGKDSDIHHITSEDIDEHKKEPVVAAHIDHPIPFNPVKDTEKVEESAESEEFTPNEDGIIVAARIDHPMPFIPVQEPLKPEDIIQNYVEYIDESIEDAAIIFDDIVPDNISDDLVNELLLKIEDLHEKMKDELNTRVKKVRAMKK